MDNCPYNKPCESTCPYYSGKHEEEYCCHPTVTPDIKECIELRGAHLGLVGNKLKSAVDRAVRSIQCVVVLDSYLDWIRENIRSYELTGRVEELVTKLLSSKCRLSLHELRVRPYMVVEVLKGTNWSMFKRLHKITGYTLEDVVDVDFSTAQVIRIAVLQGDQLTE